MKERQEWESGDVWGGEEWGGMAITVLEQQLKMWKNKIRKTAFFFKMVLENWSSIEEKNKPQPKSHSLYKN